jgi:hypothetical protein
VLQEGLVRNLGLAIMSPASGVAAYLVIACELEIMTEPTILETNAGGELPIPAGVLGAGPHARFRLEQEGRTLRLVPEAHPLWETLSPDDRACTFHEWVARLPKRKGPAIPAGALRRKNLYD